MMICCLITATVSKISFVGQLVNFLAGKLFNKRANKKSVATTETTLKSEITLGKPVNLIKPDDLEE